MGVKVNRLQILFAWLFLSTGIFALVGGLFTWGKGWLFSQTDLSDVLLPIADMVLTSPLSLVAAYGLWRNRVWGIYLGLVTAGIYLYGSVLVFILLIWFGKPYPMQLVVPPVFGLGIAVSYIIWVMIKREG
jgi:hypothetical protein